MKFDPVTYRRMKNVLDARDRAKNPKFKALYNKIFDQLFIAAI